MDEDMHCRQANTSATMLVAAKGVLPLHLMNEAEQEQVCFRLTGIVNEWYVEKKKQR